MALTRTPGLIAGRNRWSRAGGRGGWRHRQRRPYNWRTFRVIAAERVRAPRDCAPWGSLVVVSDFKRESHPSHPNLNGMHAGTGGARALESPRRPPNTTLLGLSAAIKRLAGVGRPAQPTALGCCSNTIDVYVSAARVPRAGCVFVSVSQSKRVCVCICVSSLGHDGRENRC
jgi:hypothetical protein